MCLSEGVSKARRDLIVACSTFSFTLLGFSDTEEVKYRTHFYRTKYDIVTFIWRMNYKFRKSHFFHKYQPASFLLFKGAMAYIICSDPLDL